MEEKCASTKSKFRVPVLNYSILMMRPYSTKGNRLPFIGDVLVKAFIREPAIIGMIMLGRTSSLRQNLLICTLCQQSYCQSKIPNQITIDKIANVIAKIYCSPHSIACRESCHLRNQARLSGDNLINRCTIPRPNLIRLTNTATSLALPMPRMAMCLTKLASNALWMLIFTCQNRLWQNLPLCELE
jgi:hypothetical protein